MNYPIYIDVTEQGKISVPKKEIKRYLGYGRLEMTPEIEAVVDEMLLLLERIMKPRACYTRLQVQFKHYPEMDLGFDCVRSEKLWKNLYGCREIFLFAATIGPDIDRQIRKFAKIAPSKSVILQAIGAAAIEEYCDLLEMRMEEEVRPEGLNLRPRFSPGYGDFALTEQNNIFRVLDPPRKAGITLTDQMLMVPEKSVTAVIGLTKEKPECEREEGHCRSCGKAECMYRSEEEGKCEAFLSMPSDDMPPNQR